MDDIKKGNKSLYIGQEDAPTAEMTFHRQGEDAVLIDRTFVDESLRGQGIAGKLLEEAVALARQEGRKIIPGCTYVQKAFERDPQAYADVRQEG